MYVCWRGGWIIIPETRGARPGWGPEIPPAPRKQPHQVPGLLLPVWAPPTCPHAPPPWPSMSLSLCHHPHPLPTPISLCPPHSTTRCPTA